MSAESELKPSLNLEVVAYVESGNIKTDSNKSEEGNKAVTTDDLEPQKNHKEDIFIDLEANDEEMSKTEVIDVDSDEASKNEQDNNVADKAETKVKATNVDDGPEEGEDLEDGEIDDDDEDGNQDAVEVEEVAAPHKGSKRRESRKSHRSQSKGHDEEEVGSDFEHRSSKHKKHKSERRKERSKRDLEKELKSDEEKKRLLKEKLRALELQMGDDNEDEEMDDEEMGIYTSGGSPLPSINSRKRMAGSDESENRSSRSRSTSPSTLKRKRRNGDKPDRRQHRTSDQEQQNNRPQRNSRLGVEKSTEICKLFMLGKCPKSPHTCMFSHNAEPPKIMELCKFYLFERCAKKEKCLYLHKGFPCKYYHTGHRCLDTDETCKFSHEPLSDITRVILLKHLESAPKDILGDFPRLTREAAQALVFKTEAKHKGWLDDLEDDLPEHLRNQTRSAGDSFIEQQPHLDQGPFFGNGPALGGNMDDNDRKRRPSRWGDQAPNNFRKNGPNTGPFMPGPGAGSMGGPMMGPGGPRGGGKGLLGQGPSLLGVAAPKSLMSLPVNPPASLMAANNSSHPAFPPGYGEGGFNEGEVKAFLKSQRDALQGKVNELTRKLEGPAQHQRSRSPDKPLLNKSGSPQQVFPTTSGSFFGQDTSGPSPFRQDHSVNPFGSVQDRNPDEPPFKKGRNTPSPTNEEEPRNFTPVNDEPINEEEINESMIEGVLNLPKTQERLFDRIQQKHIPIEEKHNVDEKQSATVKEDNWYSSDEEAEKPNRKTGRWDVVAEKPDLLVEKTIAELKPPGVFIPPPLSTGQITLPKELTDVLSSIVAAPKTEPTEKSSKPPSRDPRMNRDPRFARMQSKDQATENKSSVQQQPKIVDPIRIVMEDSEKEKEKRILEMDLSIFGELELPSFKENEVDEDEEDRMGLPFKPHRVQPAAKEIDATICSHFPLDYKLRPLALTKPDYSSLVATIPVSRIQQDPRLRRYSKMRPLPLEPEVAAIEAKPSPPPQSTVEKPSDPRRKAAAAASGPSSTPPQLQLRSPVEANQSKPNAYNPKNDLYSARQSRQQGEFDYPQQGPQAEVYSPSQDVQNVYRGQGRGPGPRSTNPHEGNFNPREGNFNPREGNFNPRDDFGPGHQNNHPNKFYDNDGWNERGGHPQGHQFRNRNWGPPHQGGGNNWGPNSHPGPNQDFYDGPPGPGGNNYYDDEHHDPQGGGFYNNYDNFNNQSAKRGMMGRGGGHQRGGSGPGGPSRNVDSRGHRRDPRQRD